MNRYGGGICESCGKRKPEVKPSGGLCCNDCMDAWSEGIRHSLGHGDEHAPELDCRYCRDQIRKENQG